MTVGALHQPLRLVIRDELRRLVITGELPPGARLVEDRLAERLGVSRNPVREALQTLAAEGFVDMVPRRGAFVAEVTANQAEELFDVRLALEPLAGRLAARNADAGDLERMRDVLVRARTALEVDDLDALTALNAEFHQAVVHDGAQRLPRTAGGPDVATRAVGLRRERPDTQRAVVDWCGQQEVMDTSGERHRGLLTGDDLADWQPTVEPSVSVDYAGLTIHKTGPWGQGPVLLQQLQLLAGFDLPAMGHLSVEWVHTVTECVKLAFADREAWYGDPRHVDVPLDALLSDGYARQRRSLVGAQASYELRPGSPGGRTPRLPAGLGTGGPRPAVTADGAGEPTVLSTGETRGDTCHVDVVDRDGLMVSATPSGGWLQSSPVIPALGFPLGSRAQMTWLEPGLASSLAGGVRPRTTLSPSLATRDGRPVLAFGTPGGDQQDQWQLVFLLAHLHAGLDLQAAIDAPAFHSLHPPSSFYPRRSSPGRLVVEGRLGPQVVAGLRERGHDVQVAGDWSQGRLSAVGVDPGTGFLTGAANPRGMQGYAVGR